MSFQIEKNVPLPDGTSARATYPFASMKRGDSFFVPAKAREELSKMRNRISAAVAQWSRRHGRKITFTVRSVDGGVRVWRIK